MKIIAETIEQFNKIHEAAWMLGKANQERIDIAQLSSQGKVMIDFKKIINTTVKFPKELILKDINFGDDEFVKYTFKGDIQVCIPRTFKGFILLN